MVWTNHRKINIIAVDRMKDTSKVISESITKYMICMIVAGIRMKYKVTYLYASYKNNLNGFSLSMYQKPATLMTNNSCRISSRIDVNALHQNKIKKCFQNLKSNLKNELTSVSFWIIVTFWISNTKLILRLWDAAKEWLLIGREVLF